MTRILALLLTAAGTLLSLPAAEIFPHDTQWKYLKGFGEASNPATAWREIDFDDSGWDAGDAAFYYGDPFSGTTLNDMRDNYTSVYFRKTFTVSDPNAFSELALEVLSDDGLIAWINGQEVGRFNMPQGERPYNGASLNALPEPVPYETYIIDNPGDLLVAGENVVAVHAFNSSLSSSSDFVFTAKLSGTMDEAAPVVEALIPADRALVRSLTYIEVIFNEGVTGVEASDLLINGEPAESITPFGTAQYIFEFPEPPTGTVDVAWVADHGIRDLSPLANAFAGGSWSYDFDPDAPLPGVIISEFMADNNNTLNDGDGDASDWIELFNAGTESANLDGWFLTDEANRLTKWRIPNVSIAPNSYLVIFASEKDRRNPADDLHTNFKLGSGGEYLALVGPRTNVVSEFSPAYPAQSEDISYGRERSNPGILGFFPTPTPGSANTAGGPGFAADVIFSVTSSTFRIPFNLTLSTVSPEAVIRYEIGTNMPSETSPVYSGPINISGTTQVRARAYETGLLPGEPRSEMFINISSPMVNVTSDLPIVVLHNYGAGTVSASSDKFVMMQVFEPKNGVASLTNAPDLATRARFKRRGSSTEGLAKVSMAVESWDEYGDDKNIPLLGMPEESDWVFYAPNFFEPVMIHNPFMYQLSREIGQYASRTRFVEVYLNTDGGAITSGNYWGIYVVEEKIKRDSERVDIEKLEPEHLEEPEVTGGYLLKIDRPDPGDSPFYAAGQGINYVDPKGEEIRAAGRDPQEQYIQDYFDDFGQALDSGNFDDPVNGYAKYIEVPAAIDHHLLNVVAFNVDALRLSTYFHKDREGKIVFGPIWDFDRALGSTDGRDSNPFVWRAAGGDQGTDFFNYPWWGRMFSDLEFWQQYIDRYEELRRDQFSIAHLHGIIDAMTGELRNARPREYSKWGWGSSNYENEVRNMKNWLENRIQFMDGQFLAPPTPSRAFGMVSPGTELTLTAPEGGTIYYTLDGRDPRARGGGIAPGALTYSGPITVNENVRIFARARNLSHSNLTGANNPPRTTPWSGATIGTYAVEIPALAITEIMYNPAPRHSALTNDFQDYEFIEVMNIGESALDMGDAVFTDGIEFVFPEGTLAPGERILVVKNRAAFEAEHGTGHNVAGEFTGSLNNAGEMVALSGRFSIPVVSFQYDPAWEPLTDGPGFSLVLRDEQTAPADYGLADSWTHSGVDGGSPGEAESTNPTPPLVVVNELLSRATAPGLDAVELHNPGNDPVDISGWFLTDSFENPRQYEFPAGTVLAAGEYLVVTEADFNQGATGFAFGSEGDEVFLFSGGSQGELTGFYHGFTFGPAFLDMTFGRHESSDGKEHFVRQSASTLGGENAAPAYGPVVIGEIHYYPPMDGSEDNNRDEFIELQNVTEGAVALFDETYPANTWRLRGGSDFEIPEGVTIPEGGVVLLVSFDPATNATTTSAFRTMYDINETVPIFGPYRGQLTNTGGRLSLQEPDARTGTDVEYVVVDEVTYAGTAPWPEGAAGTGSSLQRLADTFANDPASWQAAAPTAGEGFGLPADPDPDGDGLPTDWEMAHGLDPESASGDDGADGDPDGDGIPNSAEYVAGTDPQDSGSYLQLGIADAVSGARTLLFEAAPGKSYSILYRTSLSEGSWQKLVDVPADPAPGVVEIEDDAGDLTRFYRLVTPQQP